MKNLTLSVSQFNTFVKNILDAEDFLSNVSVFGEITNFKISGGNAYFDLKDETALLSCVNFGASELSVKSGDRVVVYGKVNFYVKSGRLNFVAYRIEKTGLGELYQKFIELKQKLEAEGMFDEASKKPIPRFAHKVGVVTSETGAVIRDIIHVARSKNPYTDIIVFPSKVQGVGAEQEIVRGIEYFDAREDIDTIIVARGGGSMEDLAPFNTELVARAVFAAKKPIISAVGHETDFTLCDFASDLRVPTPSVAAEVAFFNYFEEQQNIVDITQNLSYKISKKLNTLQAQLSGCVEQIIDKTKLKMANSLSAVQSVSKDISAKIQLHFAKKQSEFNSAVEVIEKLSPLQVLRRGFAAVECDGKRITAKSAQKGKQIAVYFDDGDVLARVEEVKIKEKNHDI